MVTATVAKTGSAVAAAVAVAMAVADNNRNCGGRQQSTKCSISSSGDSGRGSGNCDSAAVMAGMGGGTAEVTTMRAATTATTGEFIPPFSLHHGKVGCCKIEGERWNGQRR